MSFLVNSARFAGAPAVPLPIALGARLWIRSDLGIYTSADTSTPATSHGDRVQLWQDQSGGGFNLSQSGLSSLRPTLDTGTTHLGRSTIRFTAAGVNQMVVPNTCFSGMTSGELFVTKKMVADPAAAAGSAGLWTMNDGSSFSTHHPWTDGTIYDNTFTDSRKTVGNPTPALTNWHVYHVRSASGDWEAYLDNTSIYSTSSNTPAFPGGIHACYLGKAWNDAHHLDGWIAELVIIPTTLSSGDRAALADYMANG